MKKIKYIALGVFATLLSSCGNDWLDLQSSTAIETDGSLTELRDFEFVLNGLIPVAVICWSYEFLIDLPVIREILQFMGKHSANVFYIHSFIRAKWLGNFVYSFGHAFLIWLVLMASSMVVSILLEGIKKAVRFERLSGKISDRILDWADKTLWYVSRNGV